ncbi:hypothetical protein K9N68_24045 [Kovacikia minuta CCNUW1]|uniref:hypothetical protein n=1 Tax=Kovacikia minuta TaxID=2931930 RepID=UPI001CCBCEDC|nr:hypothetical protein [Kovacikia minuta]UBF24716.1 hypothetical protein K9N68_24045 [Kovacikia minuta CCNUW1]
MSLIYSVRGCLSLVFLLAVGTGCTQLKEALSRQMADADFEIRITENSKGTYAIAGNTDLPDKSKVAIAAVRYLYAADQASKNLKPNPTYSILDYQLVEVKQGTWQATLNLWQTAPNGRLQEAWQFDQSRLKTNFEPTKEVVFLATVAPAGQVDQLKTLEEQLAKQNLKLNHRLIQTTADGQQYVQASQTQAIAPPIDNKMPLSSRPEEINGGWGNRFLMPPESQPPYKLEFPKNRQTNAPASPQEFLK